MMARRARHDGSGIAELSALVNLGPVSAGWLVAAGIHSREQLERLGAVRAFHRVLIHRGGIGVSRNLLYALDGALRGVRWDHLPPQVREELRRAADAPSD